MTTKRLKNVFDLLDQIETTSGDNDKMRLMSEYKDKELLKTLLNVAVNPYKITQISETIIETINDERIKENSQSLIIPEDDSTFIKKFNEVTTDLATRKISGKNLISVVGAFINYAEKIDKRAPKWLSRILSKKLRIGVSEGKCLKALGVEFRNIELQSATDTYKLNEKCDHVWDEINDWIIEPKLDGFRYIVLFMDNKIRFISRTGREKDESMYPATRKLLMEQYDNLEGFALDCEITAGDWNETATAIQSTKNKKDDSNIKLNVFDILPISELFERTSTTSLYKRKELLESLVKPVKNKIEFVPRSAAISKNNILKVFKNVIDNGGEGVMLKDLKSTYNFTRDLTWLKVKDIMSEDFKCVGIYEGKGKHVGKMGGIEIELSDNGERCKVGGGFTDYQIEHFWKHPEEIIGHIVEVEYRQRTKAGNLRHPVFLRIRNDKE